MADLDTDFKSAQEAVKKLSSDPGNDAKLNLYAFYKQSTEGDVSGSRPGFTDFVGRAKYDAWAKVKGRSKDDAKKDYVALCRKLGAQF